MRDRFDSEILQLLGLNAFAVAQPVYGLLGRHPEYFVSRGSLGLEVLAFVLALSLGPPAVAFVVVRAVGLFVPRARRTTPSSAAAPIDLVVAVNGVVRATTHTTIDADGRTVFALLVPESSLAEGENRVAIYSATRISPKRIDLVQGIRAPR